MLNSEAIAENRNNITCNTNIPEVKLRKDGKPKETHTNRVCGVSSEVKGFTTAAEISAIMNVLNNDIIEGKKVLNYQSQKYINARRNKLLFVLGLNLGIRASDLRELKFSFFFEKGSIGYTFKESYTFQPRKTKKTGKFVTLYFNEAVKKVVLDYINDFPVENLDEYLFKTRQSSAMSTAQMWNIVNDVSERAGIKKNIGTHTFRKTWGYWCYHSAKDRTDALVMLQQCFSHTSTLVTLRYIGILDSDKKEMYNSICLGLDD